MQHITYCTLTVFHYLLYNYVTNSNNVCKMAHNFLAKFMQIHQRKVLKHTPIGGLKFFLTMLHLESSHVMLHSLRFRCI